MQTRWPSTAARLSRSCPANERPGIRCGRNSRSRVRVVGRRETREPERMAGRGHPVCDGQRHLQPLGAVAVALVRDRAGGIAGSSSRTRGDRCNRSTGSRCIHMGLGSSSRHGSTAAVHVLRCGARAADLLVECRAQHVVACVCRHCSCRSMNTMLCASSRQCS